jgi:hypothetical protein
VGEGTIIGQAVAEKSILKAAGYDKVADSFDPLDPVALALGVVPGALGAKFGGKPRAIKTEADMRVAAALTPEEQARSNAYERSAANLASLEKAIAAEKRPDVKATLQGELDKLRTDRGEQGVAAAVKTDPDLAPAARVNQAVDAVDGARLTPDADLVGRDAHVSAVELAGRPDGRGEDVSVERVLQAWRRSAQAEGRRPPLLGNRRRRQARAPDHGRVGTETARSLRARARHCACTTWTCRPMHPSIDARGAAARVQPTAGRGRSAAAAAALRPPRSHRRRRGAAARVRASPRNPARTAAFELRAAQAGQGEEGRTGRARQAESTRRGPCRPQGAREPAKVRARHPAPSRAPQTTSTPGSRHAGAAGRHGRADEGRRPAGQGEGRGRERRARQPAARGGSRVRSQGVKRAAMPPTSAPAAMKAATTPRNRPYCRRAHSAVRALPLPAQTASGTIATSAARPTTNRRA